MSNQTALGSGVIAAAAAGTEINWHAINHYPDSNRSGASDADGADANVGAGASGLSLAAQATAGTGAVVPRSVTALPQILAAEASIAESLGAKSNPEAQSATSPHSAEGKAARIKELFASGDTEQAMTLVNAALRGTARRRERRAEKGLRRSGKPRDPFYFLNQGYREQWSGQDIQAICNTLAKGIAKGDTSGTAVFDAWRRLVEILLAEEPDRARVAERIALAIHTKDIARNDANRKSLCNGLTEIQVQVAELIGADPHEWVRPNQASCAEDDNSELTNAKIVEAATPPSTATTPGAPDTKVAPIVDTEPQAAASDVATISGDTNDQQPSGELDEVDAFVDRVTRREEEEEAANG